jgi:hypothetical protein
MKRIFILMISLVSLGTVTSQAQTVLEEAKKAGKVADILPVGNVSKTAAGIMEVLSSKLSLTETQSPKILESVTDFLKAKSGIVALAKKDPAGYVSKFGEIKDRLMSTFKTALTPSQFTNLLSLKPTTSTSGNVLSHLFY